MGVVVPRGNYPTNEVSCPIGVIVLKGYLSLGVIGRGVVVLGGIVLWVRGNIKIHYNWLQPKCCSIQQQNSFSYIGRLQLAAEYLGCSHWVLTSPFSCPWGSCPQGSCLRGSCRAFTSLFFDIEVLMRGLSVRKCGDVLPGPRRTGWWVLGGIWRKSTLSGESHSTTGRRLKTHCINTGRGTGVGFGLGTGVKNPAR